MTQSCWLFSFSAPRARFKIKNDRRITQTNYVIIVLYHRPFSPSPLLFLSVHLSISPFPLSLVRIELPKTKEFQIIGSNISRVNSTLYTLHPLYTCVKWDSQTGEGGLQKRYRARHSGNCKSRRDGVTRNGNARRRKDENLLASRADFRVTRVRACGRLWN